MLPSHRRRKTCQSTLPLCWWIEPPTSLVAAANHRSVPTAEAGAIPNSSTRIGVISEPPPTPVRPTMTPTPKPAKVFSQFIQRSLRRQLAHRPLLAAVDVLELAAPVVTCEICHQQKVPGLYWPSPIAVITVRCTYLSILKSDLNGARAGFCQY